MTTKWETSGHIVRLSFNNDAEGFVLPVNPESIEMKESGTSNTYNIVGESGSNEETRAGEINVITSPKLREISFNGLFPADDTAPYLVTETWHPPMEYVTFLRKWMMTRHPIRFRFLSRTGQMADKRNYEISMPASIESFDWKEAAGSPGDIEYKLQLKEYVFYAARRVIVQTDEHGEAVQVPAPPERPDERLRPTTYVTQPGDNLVMVALRMYNDSTMWEELRRANHLAADQALELPSGRMLQLPPPPR